MRHTEDTRGHSFWDVFGLLPGQINISTTLPGQKRGFHLHKKKTDHWFLLQGKQYVVLMDQDKKVLKAFEMNPGDLIEIVPGIWHAYQNIGDFPSVMVYYETNKSGVTRDDDFEMPLTEYGEWPR